MAVSTVVLQQAPLVASISKGYCQSVITQLRKLEETSQVALKALMEVCKNGTPIDENLVPVIVASGCASKQGSCLTVLNVDLVLQYVSDNSSGQVTVVKERFKSWTL